MYKIKKRSTDNLLRTAKKLIARGDIQEVQNDEQVTVRIVENRRNHEIPDYIELSPSEFMSWWITSTKAKKKACNILLTYMKIKFGLDLPRDYRTLLRTPKKSVPTYIGLGSYIHVGIGKALERYLTEANIPSTVTELNLQFFVDGLKISRSTKSEFWIIMLNVRNKKIKYRAPKVVGVHHGEKKPEDFNEFLWPFVMELLDLLDDGIKFKKTKLKLKILNFVLDSQARTYCKCVTGVTGYFGCDYCLVEGDYINHRVAFLETDASLRNDVDYRKRVYDDYHKMESVLEMLPINMIDSFPPDYLHCVLLGVVEKILTYLRDTSKILSGMDYIKIKDRILTFRQNQPLEFQRRLRAFTEELGHMKGTEFRQYLLFVFPLLLKGIVSEEIIGHFLKLQIASIIFTHKRFSKFYEQAEKLMKMFIDEYGTVYDPSYVSYVVHSLCHMRKYVELYGPWDNFSTFEYESQNSSVKKLLEGHARPLAEVTNRIMEIYAAPSHSSDKISNDIEAKGRQEDGSFGQLKFYDLCFKPNESGQNLMLLKSGKGVKLISITQDRYTGKIVLTGAPFRHQSSVYDEVDTTRFNIFKSQERFNDEITFEANEIDGKMWKLNIYDSTFSAYYPIYVENGKSFSRIDG